MLLKLKSGQSFACYINAANRFLIGPINPGIVDFVGFQGEEKSCDDQFQP